MRFPKFPTEPGILVAAALGVGISACRLDMHDAPRYDALEESPLWDNGQASRTPVPGTVARGMLRDDQVEKYTGRNAEGAYIDGLPPGMELTESLLAKGRERYDVFCSPCHGYTGYGNGMIVQRGFHAPPSFHSTRLKEAALGHYYDVISNGYGAMYSYGASLRPDLRWAVAAYIRVLQLSQDVPVGELTVEERAAIDADGEGHGSGGHGATGHGGGH